MSDELKLVRELLRLVEAKLVEAQKMPVPPTTKSNPAPEWSDEAVEFLEEADYES